MMKKLFAAAALFLAPAMAFAQSSPAPGLIPANALSELTAAGKAAAARGNLGVVGYVKTDAALKALPLTGMSAGAVVLDSGYYAEGDMPEVTYKLQTSACSLNSGAGDAGSQIPSNTSGNCWVITPQTTVDFRWWGAVPSYVGADPNGNNAALINAAITYAGSVGNTLAGGLQAMTISGGGLQYGINAPVINNSSAGYLHFENFGLRAVSTSGFTGGCAQGLFENEASATDYFDNIVLDSNFLPINGLYSVTNGTNRYNDIYVQRWEGACSTSTTSVTTTSGSLVVADTNTSGLTTGLVSRGNSSLGIPDRSVIVQITANTSFTISKAATASASGTATFNGDSNGFSFGYGGTNTGGTLSNINAFEYGFGDSQASINADRYGADFACFSGCNDLYLQTIVFGGGVTGLYMDTGSGGMKIIGAEFNNSNFATVEPNSSNILAADNSGNLKIVSGDMNGGDAEIFVASTAGNNPALTWVGAHFSESSNVSLSPDGMIQIYNGITGTNAANINVDPLAMQLGGHPLIASFGPGTYSTQPTQFTFNGGNIDNVSIGNNFQLPGAFSTLSSNTSITAGSNSVTSSGRFLVTGNTSPTDGMNLCAAATLCLFGGSAYNNEDLTGTSDTVNSGMISGGTHQASLSGCSTSSRLGGSDTGSFVSGTAGTCTVTVTINGATGTVAPNGWWCQAQDLTTPADKINETAYTTTTATISGTTASGDLVTFSCKGF